MKTLFLALFWTSLALAYPAVPDDSATPGELCSEENRDFAGYRYQEQIPYCQRNVGSALKTRIYDAYGIPRAERTQYTIDHLIPLSIGGNNSVRNLWPEHRRLKATRPDLEIRLYTALKDGEMGRDEAVEIVLRAKFSP